MEQDEHLDDDEVTGDPITDSVAVPFEHSMDFDSEPPSEANMEKMKTVDSESVVDCEDQRGSAEREDSLVAESSPQDVAVEPSTDPPCPTCGDPSPLFGKYKKIPGKSKKGQKVQYVWRYKCRVKGCGQHFGDFYRLQKDTFVRVSEDGSAFVENSLSSAPATPTLVVSEQSEEVASSPAASQDSIDVSVPIPRKGGGRRGRKTARKSTGGMSNKSDVSTTSVVQSDGAEDSESEPLLNLLAPLVDRDDSTNMLVTDSPIPMEPVKSDPVPVEKPETSMETPSLDVPVTSMETTPADVDFAVTSMETTPAEADVPVTTKETPSDVPVTSMESTSELPVTPADSESPPVEQELPVDGKGSVPKEAPAPEVPPVVDTKKTTKTKRGRPPAASSGSPSTKKKKTLPKGYAYVVEPAVAPRPKTKAELAIVRNSAADRDFRNRSIKFDEFTQTDENDRVAATLLETIISQEAGLMGDETESSAMSPHLLKRLILCKKIVRQQLIEVTTLRTEKTKLNSVMREVQRASKGLKDAFHVDTRRVRDDVEFLKTELKFYQNELLMDARKSLDSIQKEKQFMNEKATELDRLNRQLQSLLDLRVRELKMSRERCDQLIRQQKTRDRQVVVANKQRDDAETKLKDSLYITNNAKCAHCVVSDKMKTHLMEQVADLTMRLQTTQKEREKLARRTEHNDKIVEILRKDMQRSQFEAKSYKSECDRMTHELEKLRTASTANTPRSHPSTTPRNGNETPRGAGANTPGTVPAGTLTPSESTSDKNQSPPEEGEVTTPPVKASEEMSPASLSALPPPPPPPQPFSNWISKGKAEEPILDKVRFFSSSNLHRPAHAGGVCRGPPPVACHPDQPGPSKTIPSLLSTNLSPNPAPDSQKSSLPSIIKQSKSEKKAAKKVRERERLEESRKAQRQAMKEKAAAAAKLAAASQETEQMRADREREAEKKRAREVALRALAKAKDKGNDSPKNHPFILGPTARIPKKSAASSMEKEKAAQPGNDSPSVCASTSKAGGKTDVVPPAAAAAKPKPIPTLGSAPDPQQEFKKLAADDWKEEMMRQKKLIERKAPTPNVPRNGHILPAAPAMRGGPSPYAQAARGPIPFNGPAALPRNVPPHLRSTPVGPRPFNGPMGPTEGRPLPFEPIDESWGPSVRRPRAVDRVPPHSSGQPLAWNDGAGAPRADPGWRRDDGWSQPAGPVVNGPVANSNAWSNSDSWSNNADPPTWNGPIRQTRPAAPQPPAQRRSFWDS